MEKISSRKNPFVMRLRALASDSELRAGSGETVLDGEKLLAEALGSGCRVTGLLCAEGYRLPEGLSCPAYSAPEELVSYASPVKNSPGPVFSVRMPDIAEPQLVESAVVLENIQDPGNVGTLIRTANALGIDAVILAGDCADYTSPRAVRASMGAAFRQYIVRCETRELSSVARSMGLKLYGAALTPDAADLRRIDLTHAAVAIGNEGHGLSRELLEACEGAVIIPMKSGSESLNAAAAGAIIMWELSRVAL